MNMNEALLELVAVVCESTKLSWFSKVPVVGLKMTEALALVESQFSVIRDLEGTLTVFPPDLLTLFRELYNRLYECSFRSWIRLKLKVNTGCSRWVP